MKQSVKKRGKIIPLFFVLKSDAITLSVKRGKTTPALIATLFLIYLFLYHLSDNSGPVTILNL